MYAAPMTRREIEHKGMGYARQPDRANALQPPGSDVKGPIHPFPEDVALEGRKRAGMGFSIPAASRLDAGVGYFCPRVRRTLRCPSPTAQRTSSWGHWRENDDKSPAGVVEKQGRQLTLEILHVESSHIADGKLSMAQNSPEEPSRVVFFEKT